MLTISEIARRADLPRRTVQFWADKQVIVPLVGSSLPPRYGHSELEVVKFLRTLVNLKLPINTVRLIARDFRIVPMSGLMFIEFTDDWVFLCEASHEAVGRWVTDRPNISIVVINYIPEMIDTGTRRSL